MAYNYSDNLEEKLAYLRGIYDEENQRQSIVEGKNAQLLGQSGVILSLVGLFIPMYFDKFINSGMFFQILLLTGFLSTLSFYFITIFKSSKYLNADGANYVRKSPGTVDQAFSSKEEFYKEEINDLLVSINSNLLINNQKVKDLKSSYNNFRRANICTAVLSILLLCSMFFIPKSSTPEVSIKEPIIVKGVAEFIDHFKEAEIIVAGDTIILLRRK